VVASCCPNFGHHKIFYKKLVSLLIFWYNPIVPMSNDQSNTSEFSLVAPYLSKEEIYKEEIREKK